jgi:proline racemase
MNCQMFSVGLSLGHLGGSGMRVMFDGTMRRFDMRFNVASYLHASDVSLEVPGVGAINVDVAYG